MTYIVNTFDVCVQGFERLRSNDEFILTAYIDDKSCADSLLDQWNDDINAVMREDDFDYDACRACVKEYWERVVKPAFDRTDNPFALEAVDEDDEGASVIAFLFIGKE